MNQYTEDFKLRIVQMKNAGKPVSELCREFDLKGPTIYAWCKKYSSPSESKKLEESQLTAAELENIELKKQLKQLEMENDILKQAALIMGKK